MFRLPAWLPPLLYFLLALCFLWRSSFLGEAFLPARLLGHIAPWKSIPQGDTLPPWNPLRWDGIGQFYPWRHFAHETVRQGIVPLWNPYQFCGTPFVANSQSAVFYPGNLLFYLIPTVWAFGASSLLHLTLCGWFTYLLLRRLGAGEAGALLSGCAFAFSAWEVQWLQLPTFLATSCWIPLLLRQIHVLSAAPPDKNRFPSICALGSVIGLMLLGGHLQIAFYGLLAGTLFALSLLGIRLRQQGRTFGIAYLFRLIVALKLGILLALPQLLPSIELSRMSHRQASPTVAGYTAYVEYALPTGALMGLTVPEFFGTDYDPANPYYGFYVKHTPDGQAFAVRHNAAETAIYVGILPLLLALLAITRQGIHRFKLLFFGALALFALLLALGTPLDALFYFGVPGFGQSGSPARCLVLWALAIAVLAGFGLDTLLNSPSTKRDTYAIGGLVACFVVGISLAAQALRADLPMMNELKVPVLGEALARVGMGWIRLLIIGGAGTGLLAWVALKPKTSHPLLAPAPLLALLLTVADLFITGIAVNPTAPASAVYPTTPGIQMLQAKTGHSRILPVNKFWNQNAPPPAILPPNAGMVYGLRDVQGYDSLLTGNYKRFADQLARPNRDGSMNASPVEVGNMVFIQNPLSPLVAELGASYAITLPTTATNFERVTVTPQGDPVYNDEMALFPLAPTASRAKLERPDGSPLIGAISFQEDSPTRVELSVNSPEPGRLLLADAYYPGWTATVDNRPVTISPAGTGGVFRAVEIPAASHTVRFQYKPTSFRLGLYFALFALFYMALMLTGSLQRKR